LGFTVNSRFLLRKLLEPVLLEPFQIRLVLSIGRRARGFPLSFYVAPQFRDAGVNDGLRDMCGWEEGGKRTRSGRGQPRTPSQITRARAGRMRSGHRQPRTPSQITRARAGPAQKWSTRASNAPSL
jgi:hypothetical protein